MNKPNIDEFYEVINGPETYQIIASELIDNQCCVIAWSDGHNTHHDVLFTLSPRNYGRLYGGIIGPGYLFVTLIRHGAFAFKFNRDEPLYPSYVMEKLFVNELVTGKPLTELINGVINAMEEISN